MKKYQIKRRIKIALDTLRVNDNYLLKNDVSERSIAHRLALYLENTFGKEFNVDCEYNKDIEQVSGGKKIMILEDIWREYHKSINSNEDIIEDADILIEKSVIPDIIVHKRGRNDKNLIAIEIKKSSSRVNENYDFEKLKAYTNTENNLHYEYGIFIKFYVNQNRYSEPKIVYFQKGKQID
ncbi:hypothetical protein SH1V18_38080 [Vallitalea longa]|uniref:Uncharacterized protein n=1 Tax=Vallitalea longa TaxID=2936439 RepID=A0A9W5YFF7_9FIRM|nr:hypothetical protein [Vallitalea longa]GKX31328.1 hypothetical protein SH1V18_38080 [Vallitalea longa]